MRSGAIVPPAGARARSLATVPLIVAAVAAVAVAAVAAWAGWHAAESQASGATHGSIHISASYPPPPAVSSAEAIAYLNQQRAANGIPGDLADNPSKDQGCLDWARLYDPLPGQYPHEELPSQHGYTPAGNEATSSSDLSGGGPYLRGQRAERWWTADQNPWSTGPLHLVSLFDPVATSAWYGESGDNACMGTAGERAFSAPAFFSFPGNGASNIAVSEQASEDPFTPAMAVGVDGESGPNFILYPEDTDAKVQAATLTGPAGAVPVKVVRPETPAPKPNDPELPIGRDHAAIHRQHELCYPTPPQAAQPIHPLRRMGRSRRCQLQPADSFHDKSTGPQSEQASRTRELPAPEHDRVHMALADLARDRQRVRERTPSQGQDLGLRRPHALPGTPPAVPREQGDGPAPERDGYLHSWLPAARHAASDSHNSGLYGWHHEGPRNHAGRGLRSAVSRRPAARLPVQRPSPSPFGGWTRRCRPAT